MAEPQGAQEQLQRCRVEQIVDMPFVPILVVEEDPPLDLSRFWAEQKKEEEAEEEKKRLEEEEMEKRVNEDRERMKEKKRRELLKVLEALEQIAEALPRDPSATCSSSPRATSSGTNFSPAAEHGGNHGGDPARSDHGAEEEWMDEDGGRWLRFGDVPGRWYLLGSEVVWDEPGRRA